MSGTRLLGLGDACPDFLLLWLGSVTSFWLFLPQPKRAPLGILSYRPTQKQWEWRAPTSEWRRLAWRGPRTGPVLTCPAHWRRPTQRTTRERSGGTALPSPATSWRSWKKSSRRLTTLTCMRGSSWPWGQTSLKPVYRLVHYDQNSVLGLCLQNTLAPSKAPSPPLFSPSQGSRRQGSQIRVLDIDSFLCSPQRRPFWKEEGDLTLF